MSDIYEEIANVQTRDELFKLIKKDNSLKAIQAQLKHDEDSMNKNEKISKLAFCLPFPHSKEAKDRELAERVYEFLNFSRSRYYRMLFTLRSYYEEMNGNEEVETVMKREKVNYVNATYNINRRRVANG